MRKYKRQYSFLTYLLSYQGIRAMQNCGYYLYSSNAKKFPSSSNIVHYSFRNMLFEIAGLGDWFSASTQMHENRVYVNTKVGALTIHFLFSSWSKVLCNLSIMHTKVWAWLILLRRTQTSGKLWIMNVQLWSEGDVILGYCVMSFVTHFTQYG